MRFFKWAAKPGRSRRRLYLVLFLGLVAVLLNLSGCSMLMPAEIRDIEKRNNADAKKLENDKPEAFHEYSAGKRKMGYVEITDAQTKPLIIFIHGSPGDWKGWVEFLTDPELQKKAHMIAVDRPGFGGSGKGKVERSVAQQCRDIAPLLDKAQPGQRVIVVGHSYGGPVAARLAMDYGSKITDVVILAGSIDPRQEETKWYQYPADWPLTAWMVPGELVVANREIMALKGELTDMLPLWAGIHQRVSVIQGENDDLVPPENADFAKKMLTNAGSLNIIRIPAMNHFLPWKQYDVVKGEIMKHLE